MEARPKDVSDYAEMELADSKNRERLRGLVCLLVNVSRRYSTLNIRSGWSSDKVRSRLIDPPTVDENQVRTLLVLQNMTVEVLYRCGNCVVASSVKANVSRIRSWWVRLSALKAKYFSDSLRQQISELNQPLYKRQ